MAGSIRSLGDYGLTGLVVWSLCGYGLAGSGGCGLMLGSHGVGLVGSGGCGFFGFWSGLRGGVGVCCGLIRWWGGVGGMVCT